MKYVYFKDIHFIPPDLGSNSNWEFIDYDSFKSKRGYKSDQLLGRLNVSRAVFSMKLKRQPEFYLYNLLGPCWILMGLVLASFLLDNESCDRIGMLATLLLTFFFVQSDFINNMPSTPVRILMADYLFALVVFTGICTMESIIMFWLQSNLFKDDDEQSDEEIEKKKISLCNGRVKLTPLRFADALFFVLAVVFSLCLNISLFV